MYGDLPPSVILQNFAPEGDAQQFATAPEPAPRACAATAEPQQQGDLQAQPGQALMAHCNLNPFTSMAGAPMGVVPQYPFPASAVDDTLATPQKLFLGGLPWETNENAIIMYFSQFGEVLDCMVLRDNTTCKSRGFGFVTVAGSDLAARLLEMNHELDGRSLTVRRASPKQHSGGQQQQQCACAVNQMAGAQSVPLATDGTEKKIFLGGLDRSIPDEVIRMACEMHGSVVDVQILGNHSNPSGRGYGFVTFSDAEPAQKLINFGSLDVAGRAINVSRAQPKGGRSRAGGRGCAAGGVGGSMGNMGGMGVCCGMGAMGGYGMGGCGMGGCGMGGGMGGCFPGCGSCRGPGMGCCGPGSMGAMSGCGGLSGCGMGGGGMGGGGMGSTMGGGCMGGLGSMGSCGGMGGMGCGNMGGLGGMGGCGTLGGICGMGGCGMGAMGEHLMGRSLPKHGVDAHCKAPARSCCKLHTMTDYTTTAHLRKPTPLACAGGMGMGMGAGGCGPGGMGCGGAGPGPAGCCNGGGGGYGPDRTQRTNPRQTPY